MGTQNGPRDAPTQWLRQELDTQNDPRDASTSVSHQSRPMSAWIRRGARFALFWLTSNTHLFSFWPLGAIKARTFRNLGPQLQLLVFLLGPGVIRYTSVPRFWVSFLDPSSWNQSISNRLLPQSLSQIGGVGTLTIHKMPTLCKNRWKKPLGV